MEIPPLKIRFSYVLNFSFFAFPNFSYVVFFHYFSIQLEKLKNIEKMPFLGGFPIEIETKISKLISYFYNIKIALLYVISLFICVSISIGNPPLQGPSGETMIEANEASIRYHTLTKVRKRYRRRGSFENKIVSR